MRRVPNRASHSVSRSSTRIQTELPKSVSFAGADAPDRSKTAEHKEALRNFLLNDDASRYRTLINALDHAANSFDAEPFRTAHELLDEICDLIHNERLERPLRFLSRHLEATAPRSTGRPPNPRDLALAEGQTAALVDKLMSAEGLDLNAACKRAARATGGILDSKQVKTLRDNIMGHRADKRAIENYRLRLPPVDGLVGDLILATTEKSVSEVWAELPLEFRQRKKRRRSRPI